MALSPGTRLGPYEISGLLGAGGMGEVYRARDTRLDRTVAIKILPDALAADPEFRNRFDREARTISQLTHPNICTLYDVGDDAGTPYLVMELLDGETLADRLKKGALPITETLTIAIQIASALDNAHRAGIVHRDLKPGNVMLTKSGPRLLDFGLAKAAAPAVSGAGLSMLATTPPGLTAQGTILGTFQYMAPEQLEGQEADARTDMFAFGAVLYEMLTGRKAFEGKSHASLIAAILEREPPSMVGVQPLTPPALDRVVKKCLAKDPDARWQSAADLCDELKWIAEAPAQAGLALSADTGRKSSARAVLMAVSLLTGLLIGASAAGFGVWRLKSSGVATSSVARVLVGVAPADQLLGIDPAERTFGFRRPSRTAMSLSPDGQRLVFSAIRGEKQQLFMRALDRLEATPMAGTEDSDSPFFSPDGEWVAFWKGGELKKVPVGGGPAVTMCKTAAIYGASWGPNNLVVFARLREGLWQVPADGGTPQQLTNLDARNGEVSHRLPQILPDGNAVLFTIQKADFSWDDAQIAVRSLATGEQTILVEGGADARYVPTGHLVYARLGTVMAAPFDLARLELTAGAVGMIEGVMQAVNRSSLNIETGAAQFSVSGSGTLVYVPGGIFPDIERSLLWVDRAGAIQPLPVQPPRAYANPRLSPNGQRVALYTTLGTDRNVWLYGLPRGTLTRFTAEGQNSHPVWTPDGKRVAFDSAVAGPQNLSWKSADGGDVAERLTTSKFAQIPGSFSPDGNTLAFVQIEPGTGPDIWTLSLAGPDRTPRPFLQTAAIEQFPDFSPDGRWLAYTSNDSGRNEVYVQPYPGPGERHPISVQGGTQPAWAPNGRELFYTVLDPKSATVTMMAVDVATTPTFTAGVPRALFEGVMSNPLPVRGYDVAVDGRRFITTRVNERTPEPPPAQMIVVQNWFEELKRLVPTK